jgi:hypothetical protein
MLARKEISFILPSQIYYKFNVKNVFLCRVLLVQFFYKRWFKSYVIGVVVVYKVYEIVVVLTYD